jgi:nicotinic acid mononucleotide adenylyltransferase
VSPAHPTVVRQKHRFRPREIIPPRHRLAMARVAVGESKWISVDAWAITRKRIVDYMGILEHTRTFLQETFPTESQDLLILYMVKSSQILTLNPEYLRAGGFGLITVCRPVEMDRLKLELSQAVFSDIVFIVEDNAVLSTDIERVTSATVRQALMSAQPVRTLVGNGLERYMKEMKVGEKLRGDQKWTIEDKIFRFEQDDKADRPYHKLPPTHMRRLSQMPLQH